MFLRDSLVAGYENLMCDSENTSTMLIAAKFTAKERDAEMGLGYRLIPDEDFAMDVQGGSGARREPFTRFAS